MTALPAVLPTWSSAYTHSQTSLIPGTVIFVILLVVDKGTVLMLHFDATDELDARIKRGFPYRGFYRCAD